MLRPEQCRAARALLDWTQAELAEQAPISAVSIRSFEKGGEMRVSNQTALRAIFEAAGVVLIDAGAGGGPGAHLAQDPAT